MSLCCLQHCQHPKSIFRIPPQGTSRFQDQTRLQAFGFLATGPDSAPCVNLGPGLGIGSVNMAILELFVTEVSSKLVQAKLDGLTIQPHATPAGYLCVCGGGITVSGGGHCWQIGENLLCYKGKAEGKVKPFRKER